MQISRRPAYIEDLESRTLMAFSAYAQLVHQDTAVTDFKSITGKGVTVAVIDTGIDYTHPSLGGGFGKGFKVVGGYDFYDNDSDPMDEDGHGTSVAGVIAAKPYKVAGVSYQGVAPDANLVALRVGTETRIPDSNIEDALRWVIDNHSKFNISVVNLSLGSGSYPNANSDSSYADEFQTLHDLGIFVTAASGNSQDQQSGPIDEDGIAYPAADPNVFAVGAVSATDVITEWAQRGDELDLLAPGENIVMPKLGGGTVTEDGTSFASPYVAGTAALIKQLDPTALAGDIGSILMSSGKNNRDGAGETGNTTTLEFSRLDIDSALKLTMQRTGVYDSLDFGNIFDTALDSNGVLHAAYYDSSKGRLLYTTRNTSGLWSKTQIVDAKGDVGAQLSIAVDTTSKVGIGYFDVTNTSLKYASFNGATFTTQQVETAKHVGTSPSVGFDIDGNAYIAYYKRSGGDLRLAALDRDSGEWIRQTVAGADGLDVGKDVSLDIGEARFREGFFTIYDTTIALAYVDSTNGNVRYARLDIDADQPAWFYQLVDDANGVANVDMNLHAGPTSAGLQAQIAYQDTSSADVKYAYRNDTWFVETVADTGKLGDTIQLFFNENDDPSVTYFDRTKRVLFTGTRVGTDQWTSRRTVTSAGPESISLNERTGSVTFTWLNRPRSDVFSSVLV